MSINESEIFEYNDLFINGTKLKSSITKIINNFIDLYSKNISFDLSTEELETIK